MDLQTAISQYQTQSKRHSDYYNALLVRLKQPYSLMAWSELSEAWHHIGKTQRQIIDFEIRMAEDAGTRPTRQQWKERKYRR